MHRTAVYFTVGVFLFNSVICLAGDPSVTLDFRTGQAQGSWQVENIGSTDQIIISGPSATYLAGQTTVLDKAGVQIDSDLKRIVLVPADDAQPLIDIGTGYRYIFATIEIDRLPQGSWTVQGMFPAFTGVLHEFTAAYSGGDGTEANPWRISSKEDLLAMGENKGDYCDWFVMTNDINMAGEVYETALIAKTVQYDGNHIFYGIPFSGVFDGNDFKIMNLAFVSDYNDFLGLFGQVDGGKISNLGLEGVTIKEPGSKAGGLAGENNEGEILNCYSIVSIEAGKYSDLTGGLIGSNRDGLILDCYSKGDIKANESCGGLVGYNHYGEILNSNFNGSVKGRIAGGLVGVNYGNISRCYSNGYVNGTGTQDIAGGLIGYNHAYQISSNVSNCYSTCDVNGTNTVGGLVGMNTGANSIGSDIFNCYFVGDVNGIEKVGCLVGSNYKPATISNSFWNIASQTHGINAGVGYGSGTVTNISGSTTAQMQQKVTYTSAPSDWDFIDIWGIGENQTYPYLRQYPATDINQDKKVDYIDLAEMASNWLAND